jgi:iron(II)-dependent oxidoreductase
MLFDLLADEAYYSQPIALRHPIVFYEGHLPAFSFNTLVKRALGRSSIDERLESLFARGIDPSDLDSTNPAAYQWPSRDEVQAFADEADRQVLHALAHDDLDRPGHPLLDRGEAAFAILEHEAMHQETLLYIWHRLPFDQKRKPAEYVPRKGEAPPINEWIHVSGGRVTLGRERNAIPFGWDNEFPGCTAVVPSFSVQRHNVTNAAFQAFVDDAGYANSKWWRPDDWSWIQQERITHPLFWERHDDRYFWRGMFELIPLPASWPVYVSQAEAAAFAGWSGGRLLTEAEFQRAAYGTADGPERTHPWGESEPRATHGVFDFNSWDPQPAGSHPAGQSHFGIEDLVGNGWEWTSTPFAGFPGFTPMASYPEYSADFFDGAHVVMKGASPATARELLRPSFRNWFRTRYPYVYATFRLAKDGL